MKAIAIDDFGSAEMLRRRVLPCPEPRDDEVRLRVVVSGVSALDLTARRGEMGVPPGGFPWVPGFEAAGAIDAIGPSCKRFRNGDRVWALLPFGGGCGEFVVVPETYVAPMPASMLFEEAAACALDGIAVWSALFDAATPLDGAGCAYVFGAAGPAGHLAVQLALAVGARVVVDEIGERFDFVSSLGSVESRPQGPDTDAADRVLDCRSEGGAVAPGAVDLRGLATSLQASLAASADAPAALRALSERVEQRRLRPRLAEILKVSEARQAHEMMERGGFCGKLALGF